MVGEHDRGRTDSCVKHIDGRTDPVRTDGCEYVEGANGPFTSHGNTKTGAGSHSAISSSLGLILSYYICTWKQLQEDIMTMSLNSIRTKIQGYELPLLHMHFKL